MFETKFCRLSIVIPESEITGFATFKITVVNSINLKDQYLEERNLEIYSINLKSYFRQTVLEILKNINFFIIRNMPKNSGNIRK